MTVAFFLLSLLVSSPGLPDNVQAGVAWNEHGTTVLAMSGAPLAPGTKLTLVDPVPPQRLHLAVVRRELASDDQKAARMPGPYYEIVMAKAGEELARPSVAIVGERPARRLGAMWSLRLDRLSDVRARVCTSMEGVHLTLWSGPPLEGRREWHAYYYLGYDVEPSCLPAETRGGG